MNVVVVESPAKAKTISNYLGGEYQVLASSGHIRDLPEEQDMVLPDENFEMIYETNPKSIKILKDIAKAVKDATHLYLATDPDREGEAIGWHLLAVLKEMNALNSITVQRVVFHSITKSSVRKAMKNPRELDMNLVNAQQARRALDYLFGFKLSPLVQRKMPGCKSAGRVQSPALRLISERELEIESFLPKEYWTIEAALKTSNHASFTAKLVHLSGQKLKQFDLNNEEAAAKAVAIIEGSESFIVEDLESKKEKRKPKPPFTTSTLQQQASHKLRYGAKRTMSIAQGLYQGVNIDGNISGLITYMRTDSVQIVKEAVDSCRSVIKAEYGESFLPEKAQFHASTSKSAQEAHEAIRPTDMSRLPSLVKGLSEEQYRLYELIWKRTIASQMANAEIEKAAINIRCDDDKAVLRATGQIVVFEGHLKVYREGGDEPSKPDSASVDREDERLLPPVSTGDKLEVEQTVPSQHFTKPPARFSEASLVKKLEELGIGRPSTWATILPKLEEKGYVHYEKNRSVPESRGRLLTTFLTNYFEQYFEYGFTSDLEEQLDKIAAGSIEWKAVLHDFWEPLKSTIEEVSQIRNRDVYDSVDRSIGSHFLKSSSPDVDPRACPQCGDGRLGIMWSYRYGGFIGCSNHLKGCKHTRQLDAAIDSAADQGPRILGQDPDSGKEISVRKGPYGYYLQLGEKTEDEKPKRTSVPKSRDPSEIDLDTAAALLSLPRDVGIHPETGETVTASIGRYGPYVYHQKIYASLTPDEDVLSVGLNRAVSLLADAKSKKGSSAPLRELGQHPEDNKDVNVLEGRYGPYIKHGRINVTIPKKLSKDTITLDEALELLENKKQRSAKKGASKKKASKGKAKKKATSKNT